MIDPSDSFNARILIVGERESDVRLLRHMLAGAGYGCVASCVHASEVPALQRSDCYDLVVFDLPAGAAKELQAIGALNALGDAARPSVLAITSQPDQKLRALQAGARDFVAKPVEQLEMLTRLGNVLEARALTLEAKSHGKAVDRFVQDLQEQALTDPLTELLNRRFLQEFLPREAAKAHRHGTQLAVISIDLDFFKRINDTHGHEAGDLVLRKVAALLKETCRASDIACRQGGDEFSVLLPRANLAGARHKAEQIRSSILDLELVQRRTPLGAVSASLGVAISPDHGTDADSLMRAADVALYAAKASGRNCVVVAAGADEAHAEAGAPNGPPRRISV